MQPVQDNLEFAEINLDGFQVVSSDMFAHANRQTDPTCTLWYTSISFNKVAFTALNNCERVRVEINPQKKCILIIPVTAKDKDGIRWSKNIKEPVARRIECRGFTNQLYKMWEWDSDFVYRTSGRLEKKKKKVMLLYDFSSPESWKFREKEKVK